MDKIIVKKFDKCIEYHNEDGLKHRDFNRPAVEWNNGSKEWFVKGKRHRLDGPAVEWSDGSKWWWVNDKLHRLDGPAVEDSDGNKIWYINDGFYGTQEDYDQAIVEYNQMMISEVSMYETKEGFEWRNQDGYLHRLDGPAEEKINGTKEWYQNGKRHREDGPDREWTDGTKWWYKNGQLHREDGPAQEWSDGDKLWYKNGLQHRVDGPAVELASGYKFFYIDDEHYSEEEFNIKTKGNA